MLGSLSILNYHLQKRAKLQENCIIRCFAELIALKLRFKLVDKFLCIGKFSLFLLDFNFFVKCFDSTIRSVGKKV